MLAYLLALVVGIGSMTFYLSAFVLPEVHRRSDFFWSGVGLFYAMVLWCCAGQMGGAVLLGQTAVVALVLGLGYQTLTLRRLTTPTAQQTPIRLGRSGRSTKPVTPRSSVSDYEFVEDGVADGADQIRSKLPAKGMAVQTDRTSAMPRLVVPAAIPAEPDADSKQSPQSAKEESKPAVSQRHRPGPIEAIGILVEWIKEVLTPKPPDAKPVIELPPRPPSVAPSSSQPEKLEPAGDPAAVRSASPDPGGIASTAAELSQSSSAESSDTSEDSSWPEDDLWE